MVPPLVAPRHPLDREGPPFRSVVCATDLTRTSAGCTPVAYSLVADRGSVHLVHVLGPWSAAQGSESLVTREEIGRLAPPDDPSRGVRTTVHLLEVVEAARPIVRLAERVGAEAVVLGTHARGPAGRLVWGSVASEVAAGVRCLSLFVGPAFGPARDDERTVARPRTVLLPLELSPFEGPAVRVAYRWVAHGGTVHLLHAWEHAYATADSSDVAFPYHPRGEERDVHEGELRKRLERVAPGWASSRGVHTEIHVVESSPIDAIRSLADRLDVDSLVLPTHGRTGVERLWAGSVAEKALRAGHAAVVVRLPDRDAAAPSTTGRGADRRGSLSERRG